MRRQVRQIASDESMNGQPSAASDAPPAGVGASVAALPMTGIGN